MRISPFTKVLVHHYSDTPMDKPAVEIAKDRIHEIYYSYSELSSEAKLVMILAYQLIIDGPVHLMASTFKDALSVTDNKWSKICNELRNHDLMHFTVNGSLGAVPYFNGIDIEHSYVELIRLNETVNYECLHKHGLFEELEREKAILEHNSKHAKKPEIKGKNQLVLL